MVVVWTDDPDPEDEPKTYSITEKNHKSVKNLSDTKVLKVYMEGGPTKAKNEAQKVIKGHMQIWC